MTQDQLDEYGRPQFGVSDDEPQLLVGFLDYQRATLAWKCRGLSEEQLRAGLPSTALTLGGLLKHLARVEDYWFSEVVAEGGKQEPWASMPWAQEWETAATDSADDLRRLWEERCDVSRGIVRSRLEADPAALAATHPAWDGQGHPSLRWVLVHMIEEYARHNGHADLLRESVDGEVGE